MSQKELFEEAKTKIDLAGFLARYGWRWAENCEPFAAPILVSPDGQGIVIRRLPDGHWVWSHEGQRQGGSVVDAVQQLLGEQDWGRLVALLRRTLSDPPPPVPPPALNGGEAAPEQGDFLSRASLELCDLSERGWLHLTQDQGISPQSVEAFAHALREDAVGSVVAIHEQAESGWGCEVSSLVQGGASGRPGQNTSLWLALPVSGSAPTHLIVAESFLHALQAHAEVPEHLKAQVAVASTDGFALNDQSISRLETLLLEMRREHPGYGDLTLVDVRSGCPDGVDDERAETLRDLTEVAGVGYLRAELPPAGVRPARSGRVGRSR